MAELTNHIWQSTIFALVAALLTLALRQNRPQVRYWLWFSASLKFLVPFSLLLLSLGHHLEWTSVKQKMAAAPVVESTLLQVSQPFSDVATLTVPTRAAHDWIAPAFVSLWAFGVTAITLWRYRGWRRIQSAIRSSTPLHIAAPVEIRSSPGLLEPGVVGLFRPVLLLPTGILQRLTPRQLEAVLAHEMCHVRRRDNLTAALHMVVEVIFWFHPLVWWIGAHLVDERERACDEAVLSLGSQPRDYAQGILNICKSYLESPLACVSGVTGSDLKKRIQAILTGRVARDLSLAKKVVLAIAAGAAITLPIALGMVGAPLIPVQQSRLAAPKFQVASIDSCNAFHQGSFSMYSPGRLLQSQCTTMQRLIEQAYGLFANGHWNPASSLTVTGPAWVSSDLYEIHAQAADPRSRATMNGPMLQALLEDRLKLKFHRETRNIPIYALTVAEGGSNAAAVSSKLQPFQGSCTPRNFDKSPTDADCGTARSFGSGFRLRAATTGELSTGFSVLLERPVVDKTGIAGRFNMYLDFADQSPGVLSRPRSLSAVSNPIAAPPPIPFDAAKAALKNLGLSLEPTKGPGEFLVIDHLEKPSGN